MQTMLALAPKRETRSIGEMKMEDQGGGVDDEVSTGKDGRGLQ